MLFKLKTYKTRNSPSFIPLILPNFLPNRTKEPIVFKIALESIQTNQHYFSKINSKQTKFMDPNAKLKIFHDPLGSQLN